MESAPPLTVERMIALAAVRGVTLDAARAEALRPAVTSLLARLEQLSKSLSPDDPVSPGPLEARRP
jgi:hypothetical protein